MESHFDSVGVQYAGCLEGIDPGASLLGVHVIPVLYVTTRTLELICYLSNMQYFSSKVSQLRLMMRPNSSVSA